MSAKFATKIYQKDTFQSKSASNCDERYLAGSHPIESKSSLTATCDWDGTQQIAQFLY